MHPLVAAASIAALRNPAASATDASPNARKRGVHRKFNRFKVFANPLPK
jgi:hypothetical protein